MAAPHGRAAVHYDIGIHDIHAHLFKVRLTLAHPAARQRLSLPVWIPGSYLVREFSQHLQRIRAHQNNRPVALAQTAKNRWELTALDTQTPLVMEYEVYAFDASVRTAYLDTTRAFFNPTSLCLRVWGRDDTPHTLTVEEHPAGADWHIFCGLPSNAHRTFLAQNYDELADSPFTWATGWTGTYQARGVPHQWIVTGADTGLDGERLLHDAQAICETQIAFWHGQSDAPPFDRYVFMLHASAEGYGGLEHRNSTALICQRADLPRLPAATRSGETPTARPELKATDGYTTLLGLISHEYFHTWNVKRLRPREFARYNYEHENHTELLWFFEGFTSYYDDLLVKRAGLINTDTHLALLAKTINQVQQTPGSDVQTVAEASYDAWTKYYRVQENTPNATVSYYTKGALVALCLDLTLRQESHTTLDEVMRALYQRCLGGPMREADLLAVLKQQGKRDFSAELDAWVHSTKPLPWDSLLQVQGVACLNKPAPLAQQLGLRVSETGGVLLLKNVLRGSVAESAGMAAGDEWLAVQTPAPHTVGTDDDTWRVRKLDEVALYARHHATFIAWMVRDGRILRCPMRWPEPSTTVELRPFNGAGEPTAQATRPHWLSS
jgi:predicted metalloprotease with PDZ domain